LQSREGLQKLRTVLGKLHHMASPVERAHWMKELSKRTGIADRTLEEEMTKSATSAPAYAQNQYASSQQEEGESAAKRQLSRHEKLCEMLFAVALASNDFSLLEDCADCFNPIQREIFALLKEGKRSSDDAALDSALNFIVLQIPENPTTEDVTQLKNELFKEYYKERRHIITLAIKNAEANGNDAELAAAMKEMDELSKKAVEL
jgi:hypothetical protein